MVGDLSVLRLEFADADEPRRAEIRNEWDQLIQQGHEQLPKLHAAARNAFVEAPNADQGVTDLLLRRLAGLGQTDNFAEAFELAKVLADNGCFEKRVLDQAGVAAFSLNDFVAAETYLQLAKQQNVLSETGGEYLSYLPECKEAWAEEQQIRQAEALADDLPRVLLKTNRGEIEIELFENEAPNTVANFISLVKEEYYNGLTFHRVLSGFMAQTGCPKGDGTGGPGYTIACECVQPNHRKHFAGSLSMAKTEPRDTGGSQFYITFRPTAHLNGQHTVFGRVVKGMEILPRLTRRDPGTAMTGGPLPKPDLIIEATVLRDRGHEYVPKKVGQ